MMIRHLFWEINNVALFTEVLKLLNAIWPWLLAVGSLLVFSWRFIWDSIRACFFILSVSRHFNGDSKKFNSLLYELSKSHGEFILRHGITENKLKSAIYICDLNGSCVFVNDCLCEMWGMSYTDMLKFGWLKAIHEKDRLYTYNLWIECVSKNVPYSTQYKIVNQRTHKIMNVQTYASVVYDLNDIPVRYLGYIEEITGEM